MHTMLDHYYSRANFGWRWTKLLLLKDVIRPKYLQLKRAFRLLHQEFIMDDFLIVDTKSMTLLEVKDVAVVIIATS